MGIEPNRIRERKEIEPNRAESCGLGFCRFFSANSQISKTHYFTLKSLMHEKHNIQKSFYIPVVTDTGTFMK